MSTKKPKDRKKFEPSRGWVTLARTNGDTADVAPILIWIGFFPKMGMGVPFAAISWSQDLLFAVMSAADAGKTLTAAPVSIRNEMPLCL